MSQAASLDWVPCTDRLPEWMRLVLCHNAEWTDDIAIGYYGALKMSASLPRWRGIDGLSMESAPTHWAHVPRPSEGDL